MTKDYTALYVIVRSDMASLGSSAGKMMAHSGHAANAFVYENYISKLKKQENINPHVVTWMASTTQGFGTQINLKASWQEICIAKEKADKLGLVSNYVIDPTYPYEVNDEMYGLISKNNHTDTPIKLANGNFICFRHEITAIYFFGLKSQLSPILENFQLHP